MTITTPTIEELYEQQITTRIRGEKHRLLILISKELIDTAETGPDGKYNLLDFEGLGAYASVSIEAQEYVNELRKEWDLRP